MMDIREETEVALKDAYWCEVRKLFEAYLHTVTLAQEKPPQLEVAGERFSRSLATAQQALRRCQRMADDVSRMAAEADDRSEIVGG